MDAGFLNVVEIGQYFTTKDTAESLTIPCSGLSWVHSAKRRRSITTKRMDPREHQNRARIGNCNLLLAQQIWSWDQRSCPWTKTILTLGSEISHGSNKFVMNLNNNEQEIPEVQLEEYAWKLDAKDFACRSKAKAKPQRREPAGSSPRTILIGKRTPIMTYRRNWFIFFVMEIKYQEKTMERLNSGELKTIFRNISCIALTGLTVSGRKAGKRRR